jgi:hypothetical protein
VIVLGTALAWEPDDVQEGMAFHSGFLAVESTPASSRAYAVRAVGLRRGLGRLLPQRSSISRGLRLDDKGVFGGARVGHCCRRAHADSDNFGRWGRRFRVLESNPPLMNSGVLRDAGMEKSRKWPFSMRF